MKKDKTNSLDPVIEELKAHYNTRQKQGLEKYGTNLHENIDDDFLNHALEEAMDLAAYLKKLQMQTRFESLNEKVIQWADEKGILSKGNSEAQHKKTLEEVQELTDALLDNDEPETIDAIGDIVVTLIIQCKMKGLNIVDCLDSAYNVISKRTGKMIKGTFVKDK